MCVVFRSNQREVSHLNSVIVEKNSLINFACKSRKRVAPVVNNPRGRAFVREDIQEKGCRGK